MSRRRLLVLGVVAVVLAGVVLVWWVVFRGDSPASVNSEAGEQAREEALDAASDDGSAATTTVGSVATIEPFVAASGQTWRVDTSIGTFDDACLTEVCSGNFVGFRIDEELVRFGAKTVVGRTPGVAGGLAIDGSMITEVEIDVDMTQLVTDDNDRNSWLRTGGPETDTFPTASFRLTEPIELGAVPGDAMEVEVEATGELTVHGVTNTVTIPLQAELRDGVVVVFGELENLLLADYDIPTPVAVVVVSADDHATLELQLFFTPA